MIATVFMVSLRRLLHNRIELLLTFLVPIAFFSIFAIIFGGSVGAGATPRIKVVAVDSIKSDQSRAVMNRLQQTAGLNFVDTQSDATTNVRVDESADKTSSTTTGKALTETDAKDWVRRGSASIAIVLRGDRGTIKADLLSDTSDQVAPQIVSALVLQAMLAAQSSVMPGSVMPDRGPALEPAMPKVTIVDVLGGGKANGVVSMYAAGIAVMFLLFGATGGGGVLLEEKENTTLDRLLTTGLTMDQLLLGKWLYLTTLGIVQTTIMFAWGQFAFGINLLGNLDGFFIMTIVTAGAAAAFGLLLATICRTRGQLNGLSVVVVLTMSALGGSMVPRYVMSQSLRDAGLWTFNAWALDGYDKVFWRDLPPHDLWPQMSVLMLCGAVFLVTSRLLAIRWETE